MAEIIRTETRVQTSTTRRGATIGEPTTTTQIRTVVRSIHGRDVSVVRDFVRALDRAEAPGSAYVQGQRDSAGHLVGLTAEWTRNLGAEETPDA